MLKNPFTPAQIVSLPGEFFGRLDETQELERSLAQGSVAICGAIGVGKSSLLAHITLHMEGFCSKHNAKTIVAVGNNDLQTVDDVARLLLEEFVQIDERQKKISVKFPKIQLIEWQSTEICRYFKDGRHLSALQRILDYKTLKEEQELLILAVDEGDKCPIPLARFVKSLITYIEHAGIMNVRFLVTGISPFFESMVKVAPGVARIFYKKMEILPLLNYEATELIETKFKDLIASAKAQQQEIEVDQELTERIAQLSGGHPHLIQLLGSYIVEHENSDPDGLIDGRDLLGALRAICYEARDWVYDPLLHTLELEGKLEPFKVLLRSAKATLPTKIEKKKARDIVDGGTLQWLVANDILSTHANYYRLNDEFLRVRMIMDEDQQNAEDIERHLIESGSFEEEEEMWPESLQDDDED